MIRIVTYYDGKVVTEYDHTAKNKEITIGRAPGCSVRLDEASISRLHALIRFAGDSWVLERKASFGAVLLNGQEVENAPLHGGEEIAIGKFSLHVQIGDDQGKSSSTNASSSGIYQEDAEGRTRNIGGGTNGLFRFEPGTASVTEYLMQKELAVFGRGSNCDVVLLEKKASRKHVEIRRQGLSFFLKDLSSINGTLVNGKGITEVELVPGDVIQIGEGRIEFTIENKEFFAQQDQFLPVPAHLEDAGGYTAEFQIAETPMDYAVQEGMGGAQNIPGMGQSGQEEKSLLKKLFKKYRALPQTQRYIVLLLIIAVTVTLFKKEDDKPVKKTNQQVKAPPGSERKFEYLPEKQKKAVVILYDELFKSLQSKEYQKVVDAAQKIFDITDDYKDTKDYQKRAENELKKIAEEEERKHHEEQLETLRKETEIAENQGKIIYQEALKNPAKRAELDQKIQEIYSKDPGDVLAGEWQAGIKAQVEKEKAEEEHKAAKEEQRRKAELAYDAVVVTFKNEEYLKALAAADDLDKTTYDEKIYHEKVKALKEDIRSKLHSVIDPLLKDAADQGKEGGDLVKAKELYMKVLRVDPSNPDGQRGLDSIRDVLHLRARRFYAEAVLAESVSDLVEAKDKYTKCERSAPDDDSYRSRCRTKLMRFELLAPGAGGEQ